MANGHGGYRRPSSPAPVSNPGAGSRRTDGGPVRDLPNSAYGENKEFTELQQAAPVAASGGSDVQPQPVQPPTGFGAPSAHPDMPVTSGADAGAGLSMADIGLGRSPDEDLRAKFGPMMPLLRRMADSQYATDAFKAQVRQLEARIS